MRTKLHLWLPTVISVLALFVALGGPAAAAKLIDGASIKKGTVTTRQIANKTITSADVRANSLKGADVKANSLAGSDLLDLTVAEQDLADGSVTAPKLATDAVGSEAIAPSAVGGSELAPASVTGLALDAEGGIALDFPTVAANTCVNQSVPVAAADIADGTLADDVMMVTPGAFFALNFSFSVKVEGPTTAVIKMCNVSGVAQDPDPGIGSKVWRYVAIDLGR